MTGATGVLGETIACYLVEQGAVVVALARNKEKGHALEERLRSIGEGLFISANVLDAEQLTAARQTILERYGTIDVLINAAGGNQPGATIAPDSSFLSADDEAVRRVMDLNFMGTVLPTRILGDVICQKKDGAIINFASEAALRPLTRVYGYSCAKAAIRQYTRYMATELATKFSPRVRINAIAPGFFVAEQNRSLLLNEDGSLTQRGHDIISHTPMGRFGNPEDLCGTIHYLACEASAFVTGTVAVVDGGFDCFAI